MYSSCTNSPEASAGRGIGSWRQTLGLALSLGLLYGLLWHRYWVPETDGAVYLVIARSLCQGEGFTFNGALAVVVPPLWPLLLSCLLRISTSFAFLNLVSLLLMVACVLVWHRILLRLTRPGAAFALALLSGFVWDWARLSTLPFTDPLALLLLGAALLLALQTGEARGGGWRMAAVVVLVGLAVLVRYAAVLGALLVAGGLMHDGDRGRRRVSRLAAVLVLLAGFAVLVWVRFGYECMASSAAATVAGGRPVAGTFDVEVGQPYSYIQDRTYALREYALRLVAVGSWVTVLLCPPAKALMAVPWGWWAVAAGGWALLFCFGAAAVLRPPGARWLGLSVLAYVVLITIRWPHLNTRYLAPVLPLLLLGICEGLGRLSPRLAAAAVRPAGRGLVVLFLVWVAMANVPAYATALRAAHSGDFYRAYRLESKQMVDIGHYFLERGVRDGEIAVTRRYTEGRVVRSNQYAFRCLALLTGRRIQSVPRIFRDPPATPGFAGWAATNGVRFLVHRQPADAGSVMGLSMPRVADWLRLRRGEAAPRLYEVYEVTDGGLCRADPGPVEGWPTHLPAMGRAAGGGSRGDSTMRKEP